MFSKIGRFAAARMQGGKGVQKYDGFMQRNPWASTALDVGGGLALGAMTGGIGGMVGGKLGMGIAKAGSMASQMGVRPGGQYNPGGGAGAGGAAGGSQLDQLNASGMSELNDLRGTYKDFSYEDPMKGMSYDAPGGDLIDKAADSKWATDPGFGTTIKDDALDQYRNATFDGAITNDQATGFGDRFKTMYNPALSGVDATGDMQSAYTAMMGLANSGGGATAGSATAGVANVDTSSLDSFDADASFQRYATGANNRFMDSLQTGLDGLRNNAAGGNRLNTGFFDLDSGKLGRDLRNDFSNDVASRALETNNQNLTARNYSVGARKDVSIANAGNATQASVASAGNATQASIANARNRLDALTQANSSAESRAKFQRDDRNFAADRYDMQTKNQFANADLQRGDRDFRAGRFDKDTGRKLDVANMQRDDRKFSYGVQQDGLDRGDKRLTSDRTNYLDAASAKQKAWQASGDMRMRGSELMDERFRDRRNSYLDMLSATSDRAQGAQNARDQRSSQSKAGWMNLAGQAIGVGASIYAGRRSGGTRLPAATRTIYSGEQYGRPNG